MKLSMGLEGVGALFAALSAIGLSAASEIIYKCVDAQGRVTYSQCPCGETAQELQLEAHPAAERREERPAGAIEQHEALSRRLELRNIEDQLRRRERELDSLSLARDRKLAELQRQAARRPGSYLLRDRIRVLQDAARLEYDSKIAQAQRDIGRLREELSRTQSGILYRCVDAQG